MASVLGRPHPDAPLDDDVILFVVLAAGLRPVMAPVSANSGAIDPAAVPDATWSSLCGVLTTNLYGLPDRVAELRARCDRLGIPLIEDAATPPRPGSTAGPRQLRRRRLRPVQRARHT